MWHIEKKNTERERKGRANKGFVERMPEQELQFVYPREIHKGFYSWPDLYVDESSIKNAGKGVFASNKVRAGTIIPILGKMYMGCPTDDMSHSWQFNKFSKQVVHIDGNPKLNAYKNIGNYGLSIAMMVNESEKPNCVFLSDALVVAEDIEPGVELTTYYGNAHNSTRQKNRYTLFVDREHMDWLIATATETLSGTSRARMKSKVQSLLSFYGFIIAMKESNNRWE